MTTTADGGTTPPEIAPPGLAMATSAPELDPQNALIDQGNRNTDHRLTSDEINAMIDVVVYAREWQQRLWDAREPAMEARLSMALSSPHLKWMAVFSKETP
jgi:hypothetical protein